MWRAVRFGVAAVVIGAARARADDGGTGPLGLERPPVPAVDLPAPASAPTSAPTSAPASAPTSAPADKSRYTLFNPVPKALLRDMDTNRPSATDTPHTIDAGHVQFETGFVDYTYQRTRAGPANVRTDAFAFAQVNTRLGVLDRLEVNVVVDSFELDRTHDFNANATTHANGFGDTSAGFKLNLWGDDNADGAGSTALAVEPQFEFPTAGGGVGNGRFELAVNLPLLVNLPDDFHLDLQVTPSYLRNTAATGYVAGLGLAASVDHTVLGTPLDVYVEYSATATTERHVKVPQTVDVGGTYPITDRVVLDAALNLGLNRASANVEATAGVSVRF